MHTEVDYSVSGCIDTFNQGDSLFQVFQLLFLFEEGFLPLFRFCCFSSRLWGQVLPIHFMRGVNANGNECSSSS